MSIYHKGMNLYLKQIERDASNRVISVTNLYILNTLKIHFKQEWNNWRKTISDFWLCCDLDLVWINSKISSIPKSHLMATMIITYKSSENLGQTHGHTDAHNATNVFSQGLSLTFCHSSKEHHQFFSDEQRNILRHCNTGPVTRTYY